MTTFNDEMMICSSNEMQNVIIPTTVSHVAVNTASVMDSSMYSHQRRENARQIISWNFEGVLCLQQRPHNQYQHAAALTKFGQALDLLRQGIDDDLLHCQQHEGYAVTDNGEDSGTSMAVVGSIQSVPICTKDEQAMSEQSSPHNAFALYERAFFIDPTNNAYLSLSEVDMSVVIMINMAITCHQRGLLRGSQSDIYLHKALGLYKMTAALILAEADGKLENSSKSSTDNGSNGSRTLNSKTIVLALFNNMMHVYSHFLMTSEAVDCGKKLVYMLKHNYITTVSTTSAGMAAQNATEKKKSRKRSGQLRDEQHQQESNRIVFFQENNNEDHSIFILNSLLVSRSVIARLAPAA